MKSRGIVSKFALSLLILLVAGGIAAALYGNRPRTEKAHPQRPVPLVRTLELALRSEGVKVVAAGTVVPAQKIDLFAQVEGIILDQHPDLMPGGLIDEGELVVQLDPADYRLLVREREAEVVEARYMLELEEGRQVIAEREWQLFEREGEELPPNRSLALRKPHLKNARAKLAAAESRLAAAELALARTSLRAPFNALVLAETAEKGQLVGRNAPVATLAGTDRFWAQVSVPVSRLDRIRLPDASGEGGSPAQVVLERNGGPPLVREGRVARLLGELDPEGRMARLLIAIDDPLRLQIAGGRGSPGPEENGKLLLGSYARVEIDAGTIDDVYVIPREAVREQDRIWLLGADGTLAVRPTEIVWRRSADLLVRAEIRPGERLIMGRLQAPLPGMALRDEAAAAILEPVTKDTK